MVAQSTIWKDNPNDRAIAEELHMPLSSFRMWKRCFQRKSDGVHEALKTMGVSALICSSDVSVCDLERMYAMGCFSEKEVEQYGLLPYLRGEEEIGTP